MADAYNLGMTANPYMNDYVDRTMGDMARNYNLINRPQQENAMVNSGSFGNSGLQQMRQNEDRNQQQAMGAVAGNLRSNDYWTGQNFDANRFDTSFQQNRQNLGDYMGMMNQANTYGQQDIQNGTNVQNAPLDYFNQFSGAANSIGGYGGSSTSTQAAPGNPWLGALGGWSLANAYKG